jgi:hypothetical protein
MLILKSNLTLNDKTYPKMFTKLEYATKLSPNSGVPSYLFTENNLKQVLVCKSSIKI